MFKKLIAATLSIAVSPAAMAFNPLDLLKSDVEKSWIEFYQNICPDMEDVTNLTGYEAYCSGVDLGKMEMPERYIESTKSVSFASSYLTNVDHLKGLKLVDDYINLYNNNIQSLAGLSDLGRAGVIDLRGNKNLQSLDGLNNLVEVGTIEFSGTGVTSNYGLENLEKVGKIKFRTFNAAFSPNLQSGKLFADRYSGQAVGSAFCDAIEDEDLLLNPSDREYYNGEYNLNEVVFQKTCVETELEVEEQTVAQEVDSDIQAMPEFEAYLKYTEKFNGPKLFAGGRK